MSGAYWRLCFTEIWDYSCTDALVTFDYASPLFQSLGYSFRMVAAFFWQGCLPIFGTKPWGLPRPVPWQITQIRSFVSWLQVGGCAQGTGSPASTGAGLGGGKLPPGAAVSFHSECVWERSVRCSTGLAFNVQDAESMKWSKGKASHVVWRWLCNNSEFGYLCIQIDLMGKRRRLPGKEGQQWEL